MQSLHVIILESGVDFYVCLCIGWVFNCTGKLHTHDLVIVWNDCVEPVTKWWVNKNR